MFLKTKNKKNSNNTHFIIITGCAGSGKTTIGKRIAEEFKCPYIDKDTVTGDYTDHLLIQNGLSSEDRESEYYVNIVRDIEYKATLKVCEENLEIGNDVVLSIPFIAQIQDYSKWKNMIDINKLEQMGVKVSFIWIVHDISMEYERVRNRNATRDKNKLNNWDEYAQTVDGIEPAKEYNPYLFNNDKETDINSSIKEVIKWIRE